ncbi:hypothetical protein PIROE2DRAFT_63083 [Piromyces sp. E2]|nr:hypothetical protein PIROE2DRAFT_63083 [Piromyces sp. E2]|eukprot:OUM60525.1 hypothetical protein PIROE2DRAFT_63083 [Piromyces sp. E2]
MNSKINTKNKSNIRKISINGKSKQIKKNTSFFGKLLGKFSIFKSSNRNRTKLIQEKIPEIQIQKKMEKDLEIENSIKNKNVTPQDANTIFSFYSHENKKNVNNKTEFNDILKTVESSINNNLMLRNSESRTEKIKRTFLNLLDTSKSFISLGNNNEDCSSTSSKSDVAENEKILPSDIEISEHSDEESNINNSEYKKSTNNEKNKEKEKEVIRESPKNNFHFWRSSTNPIDSDDDNSIYKSNEINKNFNKNTENNDVDSSAATTNTEIISPNRILLSESYYQSKQPRKFNSLSNLYFKNSNKQLSRYLTDVTLKYVNFFYFIL